MLPEAKHENLLYVADYGVGVIVYSYRASRIKYVGLLASPQQAEGECVDKAQNIFVTSGPYGIFEYAHGGTSPIRILAAPSIEPLNCSIDPKTGNLAAVGYPEEGGSYGAAIYKNARGRPTFYADAGFGDYECGYDDKGNLFIGGYVFSGNLNFAELPRGASTFVNVALNQSFRAAGGIQWDGKHLAVGDEYADVIYQFDIRGKRGTEVGSTPLNGAGSVWQFFVDRKRVIVPSTFQNYSGSVGVYAYPGGGAAKKTRLNAYDPVGVVVSLDRTSSR
ncbi:MAG TPA: hypothetical protein VGX91_00005 [Candidatus Cybelea sp.]|nr:hypothetical protein [Candidatus Cybelea sp.]